MVPFFFLFQDRRELVVTHGGNLTSIANIVPAGTTFGAGARLGHTSPNDFQPPYFPPPYSLTQTQLDFQSDPYSHLTNSLNASTPQQYHHQLHTNPRNLFKREEDAALHLQANMLPVSYGDARRTDVTSYARRPDILVHPAHSITDQDLINLHNAGALPVLDDGQVSQFRFKYAFIMLVCVYWQRSEGVSLFFPLMLPLI